MGEDRDGPASEREVLVPLVDTAPHGRVYDRSLSLYAAVGAVAGIAVGGWLGWALAAGTVAAADLGQWASSSPALGAFTGAGIGASVLGLAGALTALYRIPARRMGQERH